jgi:MoaA/NifB/PqqE/SkfB family radical SAM enzyme
MEKFNRNNVKLEGLEVGSISAPVSVAFDVTSKCNYRCRHCYNHSGEDVYEELTDEELIVIANQIADMQPLGVCLCGGEPLIRGDVIFKIITILSEKCGNVNLVSNGWLITKDVCRKLKKSGLNTLQISLDGNTRFLHEITRMKAFSFEKALSAICNAKETGLAVISSFCPNKVNYKYFFETAELARKCGATELRTMPLILMGRGSGMKELQLTAKQYLEFQQIVKNAERYYLDKNFSVEWGDPIDHLYRMPNNSRLGFNSFSLEIRADGKLLVSAYLPIVVGDLKKHTLQQYWDAGYKKVWENACVSRLISDIYSTNQFCEYVPQAYSGSDIEIELIRE